MPVTIVLCSMPDCGEVADSKIAAPWKYGRFSELKTYGYACSDHVQDVLLDAEARAEAVLLAPGEWLGEIEDYPLVDR